MFARFRNLFAKSKGDDEEEPEKEKEVTPRLDVPSIVVVEPPKEEELPQFEFPSETETETETESDILAGMATTAPLASEEEDLAQNPDEILSDSASDLSRLLEAINQASKLPETSSEDTQGDEEDDYENDDDDDDDETASTSSVRTKIAKASIERDIILEETEPEEEDEVDKGSLPTGEPLQSLDKIKALIRNDSETYPCSDYTDNETPSHSRTASLDSGPPDNPRLSGDFSVVADELPLDCSPSPLLHDSGRTSSASGSEAPVEAPLPATVQVIPTGSNELACAAISHKLGAIAEVAESLDAVIRDVQQQEGAAGNGITSGSAGHGIKKLGSIEVGIIHLLITKLIHLINMMLLLFPGLAIPVHRGRVLCHRLRGQLHAQLALLLLPNGLWTHQLLHRIGQELLRRGR